MDVPWTVLAVNEGRGLSHVLITRTGPVFLCMNFLLNATDPDHQLLS